MIRNVLMSLKWDALHHWRFLRWCIVGVVVAWGLSLVIPTETMINPLAIPFIMVTIVNLGVSAVSVYIMLAYPTASIIWDIYHKTAVIERLINLPSYLLLGNKILWNLLISAIGLGISNISSILMSRFATENVSFYTFAPEHPFIMWIYVAVIIPIAALAFYFLVFVNTAQLSVSVKIIATVLFFALLLNNIPIITTNQFNIGGNLPPIATFVVNMVIAFVLFIFNCWLYERRVEVG